MGDIGVDIFLERLKELITSSKLDLITNENQQLVSLEEEIKYLRGFLKVTEKKRNEHSEMVKLVKKIRGVVSEAEDIVELFEIDAFEAEASYSLCELFNDQDFLSLDLEGVKKEIKTLMAEVKKIYAENMYDINGEAVKKLMKHSSTGIGSGVVLLAQRSCPISHFGFCIMPFCHATLFVATVSAVLLHLLLPHCFLFDGSV